MAESHGHILNGQERQQLQIANVTHAIVARHATLVQCDTAILDHSALIAFEWSSLTSMWASQKLGVYAKDSAALSFTHSFEGDVPCSTWTLVFYIFMQIGGHLDPFGRRYSN